jgi:hypothetical protein
MAKSRKNRSRARSGGSARRRGDDAAPQIHPSMA